MASYCHDVYITCGLCFVVFAISKFLNTLLVSYCFWWYGNFKPIFWISTVHLVSFDWLICYKSTIIFLNIIFLSVETYKKQKKENEWINEWGKDQLDIGISILVYGYLKHFGWFLRKCKKKMQFKFWVSWLCWWA